MIMTIPVNYNPLEQLVRVVKKIHNKIVREFFRNDLLDDDITSPEGAVRNACLIDGEDSIPAIILRILFFAVHCGWLEELISDKTYLIPKLEIHGNNVFAPQLVLKFQESRNDMRRYGRKDPKRHTVQFRIPTFLNSESVTQTDVNLLVNKINSEFPQSFNHYAGLNNFIYYNPKVFYKRFVVPARNKSDANILIKKYHDILNLNFDSSLTRKAERNIVRRSVLRILGENYEIDGNTPLGTIKLKNAALFLHGKTKKEMLIERIIG